MTQGTPTQLLFSVHLINLFVCLSVIKKDSHSVWLSSQPVCSSGFLFLFYGDGVFSRSTQVYREFSQILFCSPFSLSDPFSNTFSVMIFSSVHSSIYIFKWATHYVCVFFSFLIFKRGELYPDVEFAKRRYI